MIAAECSDDSFLIYRRIFEIKDEISSNGTKCRDKAMEIESADAAFAGLRNCTRGSKFGCILSDLSKSFRIDKKENFVKWYEK